MARTRFALISLVGCLSLSVGTTGTAALDAVEPALQRFLARPDEPVSQYRARRWLEGHNGRFNKHATIEAVTELSPDGAFTYTIVSESGSEYIRDKVLEPILETEAKVLESGDPSRSALTIENYEIVAGELVGPGMVKLLIEPRRKDISLLDGAVFVTTGDADLVRIEGRMAKNPSFWTTRVDVVRQYDRIGGVRVPVRLDSTAQVRFAGESTLSMIYEYEMINGVVLAAGAPPAGY
jgi:hypothetical protein